MKIGEMKAQALTLMFPQATVKFDETSDEEIIRAIYEMKSNPNFESILQGSVGAINRAFSYIESRGLSIVKCTDIVGSTCERRGGKILLPFGEDFLLVNRVLLHINDRTYELDFEVENGSILTEYRQNGVYTVVYKEKIPRITRTTSDAYEPQLPVGIAECIPYFIVSDLAREENGEMARYALDRFEKAIKSIGENQAPCHECFQIIYRWD